MIDPNIAYSQARWEEKQRKEHEDSIRRPVERELQEAIDLILELGGALDEGIAARRFGKNQRGMELLSLRSRQWLSRHARCRERESGGVQCELPAGHDGSHAGPLAIESLLERSSLGTPEAQALRASVPPEVVQAVLSREAELVAAVSCTGLSASWCPKCGDCSCPREPSGEREDESDLCPLHAENSAHGVPVVPPGPVPVIVESPYAGDLERNLAYLRACLHDSLLKGEAPFASHAIYTQPGVLRDELPAERALGIAAGFAWKERAARTVVYQDLGLSKGMQLGIEHALKRDQPVEFRRLYSRCPRCDSPDPRRHPAMQWEGEVQICSDPWHPLLEDLRSGEARGPDSC